MDWDLTLNEGERGEAATSPLPDWYNVTSSLVHPLPWLPTLIDVSFTFVPK